MTKTAIATGVVHEVPEDLRKALEADESALERWEDLTPLARNEWICWTISCRKPETRANHVDRVISELLQGMRRPCCWLGCNHR
ncbi:MAG TPA: YdeI/OmpD-associated family protein [Methylomirabilota bacterium]|nr:YdeI/OmpD-associated family protein [Methylomirabilota bacterium]